MYFQYLGYLKYHVKEFQLPAPPGLLCSALFGITKDMKLCTMH